MSSGIPLNRPFAQRLLLLILAAAAVLSVLGMVLFHPKGASVLVEQNRVSLAVIPLAEPQWFGVTEDGALQGISEAECSGEDAAGWKAFAESRGLTHVFSVSEEGAQMLYAACPDQICVHQGRQNRDGSSIVCLPYRLVLSIRAEDAKTEPGDEPDTITQ